VLSDGKPVTAAKVYLASSPDTVSYTNAQGEFSLPWRPEKKGLTVLKLLAEERASKGSTTVRVEVGSPLKVVGLSTNKPQYCVGEPIVITGRVVKSRPGDPPVPDAAVEISGTLLEKPIKVTKLSRSGWFEVTVLASKVGQFTVEATAEHPDFYPGWAQIDVTVAECHIPTPGTVPGFEGHGLVPGLPPVVLPLMGLSRR
jgi:hypothetical protein